MHQLYYAATGDMVKYLVKITIHINFSLLFPEIPTKGVRWILILQAMA